IAPHDIDVVAYSYDPSLAPPASDDFAALDYEGLRTFYVRRLPHFLASLFPGIESAEVTYVPHHLAHAASAYLCAPYDSCAVMTLDGRGESTSFLAGHVRNGRFDALGSVALPHSLGLRYEELTMHLGFMRSSDEYKVMGMAGYGSPRFAERLREAMFATGIGYNAPPLDLTQFCAARTAMDESFSQDHADLAASVQQRLQEILLEIATELHAQTGERRLTMAGGVALNCVANSYVYERSPFDDVWVQPAAGDAGTSLGAALYVARERGDATQPMTTAALGRGWDDDALRASLDLAAVPYRRAHDIAESVADILAGDGLVAWFQGRSEFGPRALGHRSLLAHPGHAANLRRLNDVKGREQFRPVAPMVLAERAAEIFEGGPLPSPYMLFTHRVRDAWRERLAAITHVDGTARVQTVDEREEPLVAAMLRAFERRTGLPVVVNTSLNTAGRPMVDEPRDALECFGSTPVDALAIGPFLLSRRTHASVAA
ncbi:MAG: carbamoyltransferase, partial [Candidatus Eremiobacteraeota bacterium]|nr:carbamoyltransferase [Candidatus Eremiobacteraeota bacterium]